MRSRRHWPVLILSWQCQSAMAAQRKSNILDIVSTNDGTQGDTAHQTVAPGRRGRPRSARVRVAVVRAAAQLTRAGGPGAATVDAIAKRAAVSRTTIYKWWPSSAAIVLHGLLASVRDLSSAHPAAVQASTSSKEALDHHLRPLDAVLTDTRPCVASARPARRRRLVRRPRSTGPTPYPPRLRRPMPRCRRDRRGRQRLPRVARPVAVVLIGGATRTTQPAGGRCARAALAGIQHTWSGRWPCFRPQRSRCAGPRSQEQSAE